MMKPDGAYYPKDGASGVVCPNCGSKRIKRILADNYDGDATELWEYCDCDNCGCHFRLVYEFAFAEIDNDGMNI